MATSTIKSALISPAMKWAVGGWSFFIAENLVLSENREYIINELGDDGYHYLYGFLSTAAMGSIFYGYRYKVRGAGPFVSWASAAVMAAPPPAAKAASFALQALALGLASQSFPKLQIPVHLVRDGAHHDDDGSGSSAVAIQPQPQPQSPSRQWKVRCPFDFTDSKSRTSTYEGTLILDSDGVMVRPHGLDRVTRHPGLWSFGLLGCGNALLVPSIPTRVWLSMPLLVAWIGGGHTDSRHRRNIGGRLPPELDGVTSNVPFWAMIAGRQEGGSVVEAFSEFAKEVKWLNAGVAVVLAAAWVGRRGRGSPQISKAALTR